MDELVSELRKAFDEDAGGASLGAGYKRPAAAVDMESAEALQRTAPDVEPGPVPPGVVTGDDPLRVGGGLDCTVCLPH